MADGGWDDDGWEDKSKKVEAKPKVAYEMAEVVDDFYPDNHDDLALMRYDLVYVFKKEGDWWEGEVNGVVGRFPAKHVRLIKDKPNKGDVLTEAIYYGNAKRDTNK